MLKASYFGVQNGGLCRTGTLQGTYRHVRSGRLLVLPQGAPMDSAPPLSAGHRSLLNRIAETRHFASHSARPAQRKGIQLLLVNPPQLCEEVFEKPEVMEGLPWIEGNEWPLAKVDTLYYDDHHLRGVGAELYSEWLAERVVALMD